MTETESKLNQAGVALLETIQHVHAANVSCLVAAQVLHDLKQSVVKDSKPIPGVNPDRPFPPPPPFPIEPPSAVLTCTSKVDAKTLQEGWE